MNLGSFSEMLFLFLLALIIFGPRRLPEIARQVGKALAEFRRASNEFKAQLDTEMRQIEVEELLRKQKEEEARILPPPQGAVAAGAAAPDTKAPPAHAAPPGETNVPAEAAPGSHA
jgi:sec-independent protein translocase protein TatB